MGVVGASLSKATHSGYPVEAILPALHHNCLHRLRTASVLPISGVRYHERHSCCTMGSSHWDLSRQVVPATAGYLGRNILFVFSHFGDQSLVSDLAGVRLILVLVRVLGYEALGHSLGRVGFYNFFWRISPGFFGLLR